MRWAGGPGWTDPSLLVGALGALAVALVTYVIGPALLRRIRTPVDEATARKTRAEAVSVEVETARALIAEVRTMLADQRADYEERTGRLAGELKALSAEVAETREQQRAMRAALATHALWDDAAVAALRKITPMFPDPPPISLPEDR